MKRPSGYLVMAALGIMVPACAIGIQVQDVVLNSASATCDSALRSGRVLGDRTDPAIDFEGGTATVTSSDGTTYKGDLHPFFSGSAENSIVSFSGDVTSPTGKQQHITGSIPCQTPVAARLPVGGSADFAFGGMRNSTCPAGSIPLGFATGYRIAAAPGGRQSLTARGVPQSAPNLAVTGAGRTLRLDGQFHSIVESIDVTVDSVVVPRSGSGTLKYATVVSGQPCGADYQASLSVKP